MKIAKNLLQILTNVKQTTLPVLLCLGLLVTAATAKTTVHSLNEGIENPATTTINVEPSATFQRMWIDYDITVGGVKGMRIHTDFKVYGMKGVDGYLALYFQERDGTSLQDNNGKFNSATGTVAVYRDISPGFQTAVYEDFDVFMPYSELDLPGGNYDLRIDADVIYKQGGLVSHLTFYNFVYNKAKPVTNPTATFGKIWADYNVTEGGRRGMRIHLKCNVFDMVGEDGYFAFYFQYKDGTQLKTSNRAYRSNERPGNLALYFDIKPGYQNTVYEDVQVFMPYEEFSVGRGNNDLQIDVDLIKKDTTLIQHLSFFDFWYERP
ncbi:hypothetical protein BH10ACI1_BH10ACI1_14200 [soil metagenome]